MNKEYIAYMTEVARQAYIQGVKDASNGYVANNPADIDDIIEQVGMEVWEKSQEVK